MTDRGLHCHFAKPDALPGHFCVAISPALVQFQIIFLYTEGGQNKSVDVVFGFKVVGDSV